MRSKRGAIELSVSTIVIIVLAMTMLILGLVLVRTIFQSTTSSITSIDDKVKAQINKLFAEDNLVKIAVYPSSRLIKLNQGSSDEGFAFSIRNLDTIAGNFKWIVEINDDDLTKKCNINAKTAEDWIQAGRSGTISLAGGNIDSAGQLVLFTLPSDAPTCTMSFAVKVTKDNAPYTQIGVILSIKPG